MMTSLSYLHVIGSAAVVFGLIMVIRNILIDSLRKRSIPIKKRKKIVDVISMAIMAVYVIVLSILLTNK